MPEANCSTSRVPPFPINPTVDIVQYPVKYTQMNNLYHTHGVEGYM